MFDALPIHLDWYTYLDIQSISNFMITSKYSTQIIKYDSIDLFSYFKDRVQNTEMHIVLNGRDVLSYNIWFSGHQFHIELLPEYSVSRFELDTHIKWKIKSPYLNISDSILVNNKAIVSAIVSQEFRCIMKTTTEKSISTIHMSHTANNDFYYTYWKINRCTINIIKIYSYWCYGILLEIIKTIYAIILFAINPQLLYYR